MPLFDDLLNLSYGGVSSEFASLAEISQTLYAEDLELTFCGSSGKPTSNPVTFRNG